MWEVKKNVKILNPLLSLGCRAQFFLGIWISGAWRGDSHPFHDLTQWQICPECLRNTGHSNSTAQHSTAQHSAAQRMRMHSGCMDADAWSMGMGMQQHSTADACGMGMGMGMHRDHGAERMHGDGCMGMGAWGWSMGMEHGHGHGSHREHGRYREHGHSTAWAWQKNAKKSGMRQAESTPHLRARAVSHRAGAQKIC